MAAAKRSSAKARPATKRAAGASRPARPAPDPSALATPVLGALQQAGARGLPPSRLPGPPRARLAALDLLARNGEARCVPKGRSVLWFASAFAPSLESATNRLAEAAAADGRMLFAASDLNALLPAPEHGFLPDALAFLVDDGTFFEFRAGRNRHFLHLPSFDKARGPRSEIRGAQGEEPAPGPEPGLDRKAVLGAWRQLRVETGSQTVYLSELAGRTGAGLGALHRFVDGEARAGRAVLSEGDWLHATDAQRAAALERGGLRFVQVRFLE